MSLLQRLFGGPRTAPPPSRPASQLSSVMTQQGMGTHTDTRRELLRVVLRDTLNQHGIPVAWMAAEVLTSTSRTGEKGIHWRLVVTHWDSRLLVHGVALQQALIQRVMSFDPLAANWLTGISWQFALEDESACPALPPPQSWTDIGTAEAQAEGSHEALAEDEAARADLEALMAIRDADFARHMSDQTQPMWANTEPARPS